MKQVFRFDANGFYMEPVILEDDQQVPSDCTENKPQDGLYKGQFLNGEWVESLTDEEINTIKNASHPPTEIDTLKANQDLIQKALDDLILGGAL
jgi:hypothetical protein